MSGHMPCRQKNYLCISDRESAPGRYPWGKSVSLAESAGSDKLFADIARWFERDTSNRLRNVFIRTSFERSAARKGGGCRRAPRTPEYNLSPLIRNPPNKKPPLGRGFCAYYQFRRRHDFPPHKIPPLGGKYSYYQFRRRHYQFRRRQQSIFIRGGFLLGGEINIT